MDTEVQRPRCFERKPHLDSAQCVGLPSRPIPPVSDICHEGEQIPKEVPTTIIGKKTVAAEQKMCTQNGH